MEIPDRVHVYEVGPRDGLQLERAVVPTAVKVEMVERLAAAGLPYVEVSSFVHPDWIPQLADADEVFACIDRRPGVRYAGMVPNLRGLDRAKAADVGDVVLFVSATESHNQANLNRSIDDSLDGLAEVIEALKGTDTWIRACVSMAFGCPFEGHVPPEAVLRVARRLWAMGIDQLVLGDTSGRANPRSVSDVVRLLGQEIPVAQMALHMHDTRGTALANVVAGLEAGVRIFDGSIGGLGGCNYCPGATGNVATDDLVCMLHGMGVQTGIDLEALLDVAEFVEEALRKPLSGRYLRAARGPWREPAAAE